MLKWSRARLVLSILTCEGLFSTLRERLQYAPSGPRYKDTQKRGGSAGAQTLSMPRYYDYAGSLHIHSTYSDGTGTVAEIAQAANEAGLDFIVMCDHSNLEAGQYGEDGWQGRTLVLVGTEVTTDAGHLLALDVPESFLPAPNDAVQAQHAIVENGGIGFIALPCDLKDHWRDFSLRQESIGLEVFNLSAIARTKINVLTFALAWLRYRGTRPQRAFHYVAARPRREIALWDKMIAPASSGLFSHQVVGIACVDAHAVMRIGGREYHYPTYAQVFRTLRTHVVSSTPVSYGEVNHTKLANATEADRRLIHRALASGHCYMAYDNYGDSAGFVFEAVPTGSSNGTEHKPALMGDAIILEDADASKHPNLDLIVRVPRTRSFVRLYRNGRLIAAARGGYLKHSVTEPGAYRAEVFLYHFRIGNLCTGAKPWIFSNPIYVQPSAKTSQAGSFSALKSPQPQEW